MSESERKTVNDLDEFDLGEEYQRGRRAVTRVQATRVEEVGGQKFSQTYHLQRVDGGWRDANGVVHTR